jgi:hypothetical protein
VMKDVVNRMQDEAVFIMAREQFSRFILSKYYKTWRSAESSYAIAQTPEDAERAVSTFLNRELSIGRRLISDCYLNLVLTYMYLF